MNHTSNKRQQGLAECSLLQKLTLLDSIVNLRLEGASCEGPLAAPPTFLLAAAAAAAVVPSPDSDKKKSLFGASVFIFLVDMDPVEAWPCQLHPIVMIA